MKKYLIMLLLLLTIQVYATPSTFDRTTLDNLGVNKKWIINNNNRNNVLSTPAVNAIEKIYDFSNVLELTPDQRLEIQSKIAEFNQKYKTDVVIYFDNFYYPYDSYNDTKSTDFYDYNDFGIDYDHYSGVLLLRNTYEQDPYYGMYMFGEAQFYIDESRWNNILDYIYDNIHSGNYYEAINDFINQINYYFEKGKTKESNNYYLDDNGVMKYEYHFVPNYKAYAIIGAIVALIGFLIAKSKHKVVRLKNEANDYVDLNDSKFNVTKDMFVTSSVTRVKIVTESSSSGGSSGGGFHSSGSSGGGFSGGGRHG